MACGLGALQILVGATSVGGECLGMGLEVGGGPAHVAGEVDQPHPLGVEEGLEAALGIEAGEVTLEDDPVEANQLPDGPILVDRLERGHGPLPGRSWRLQSQLPTVKSGAGLASLPHDSSPGLGSATDQRPRWSRGSGRVSRGIPPTDPPAACGRGLRRKQARWFNFGCGPRLR
jgi:hypothetical protein